MISQAMKTSFANDKVLALSVKLDQLLNLYEATKSKVKTATSFAEGCCPNL